MKSTDEMNAAEFRAFQLRLAMQGLERQYGLPSGLPQLRWIGEQWAAGNQVTRADADRHFAQQPKPSWIAYNATPETAPVDEDVWNVSNGRQTVKGFTPRYAESVAEALNSRDLTKALGISLGLRVSA